MGSAQSDSLEEQKEQNKERNKGSQQMEIIKKKRYILKITAQKETLLTLPFGLRTPLPAGPGATDAISTQENRAALRQAQRCGASSRSLCS
jgi:hypothetical protein